MSKAWHLCETLEDHFLYFLDCQLGTVEGLEMLKSPPKSRLRRHRGIASKMIDAGRKHGLPVDGLSRVRMFEENKELGDG